ncbi:MAG: hypothetical protein LBU21_09180 [Treponema sp.]|jgi:hypothetical protein|nr:hypothetical protein [Treponema sp.]
MFDAFVESVLRDKRQAVKKAVREEQEKAREEAAGQEREKVRRLKQLGVSPDIIAAGFGLSREEIEGL